MPQQPFDAAPALPQRRGPEIGAVTYRKAAASSLEAGSAFSTRMPLLMSGIIAGVADALNDQSRSKKAT